MSERKTHKSKFNKDEYWKRRSHGLHGTRHAPSSDEERYDARKIYKEARSKAFKKLTRGKDEIEPTL